MAGNNLSPIFRTFLCWLSKVINIESENSILNFLMHFPLSLYHFPPFSRIFPLQNAKAKAFLFYYSRFLSFFFLSAGLNWDLVFESKWVGGGIFPTYFTIFLKTFCMQFILQRLFISPIILLKTDLLQRLNVKHNFILNILLISQMFILLIHRGSRLQSTAS